MIIELYKKAINDEEICENDIKKLLEIRLPNYDINEVKAFAYILDHFCMKKFKDSKDYLYTEEDKKLIADILMNIGFTTHFFLNEHKIFHAYVIYNTMRIPFSLLNHSQAIKYISWVEYIFDLCYILKLNNDIHEATVQCLSVLNDYYKDSKVIEKRIISEEDNIRKSHSDKAIVYSFLIKLSKLGTSLSMTSGLHSERSKFVFYENYFTEKLFWICESFPSITYMISMRPKVHTFYSNQTLVGALGNMERGKITFFNIKSKIKSLWLMLLRLTIGYGEKPFRLLISSFVLIFVYSIFYLLAGGSNYQSFPAMMFKSFLIFTSYGVDEIFFQNYMTKLLFISEVTMGIIFINGFIISLARKYLR
ncbi:MAG: hypothetical protein WC644_10855 [Ignavibacteria bacterium]